MPIVKKPATGQGVEKDKFTIFWGYDMSDEGIPWRIKGVIGHLLSKSTW